MIKSLVFSNFYLTKTVLVHIKTHFQKSAITASMGQILDCFCNGIEFTQSLSKTGADLLVNYL